MLQVKSRHIMKHKRAEIHGKLLLISTSDNAHSIFATWTNQVVWVRSAIRGNTGYHNLPQDYWCPLSGSSSTIRINQHPDRHPLSGSSCTIRINQHPDCHPLSGSSSTIRINQHLDRHPSPGSTNIRIIIHHTDQPTSGSLSTTRIIIHHPVSG